MKNYLAVFLLLLLLPACSATPPAADGPEEGTQTESFTVLEEGVWPENVYTDGLPIPAGTVRWAALDEDQGYCAVSLADMEETDLDDYMELLGQEGFSVVADTSERIGEQGDLSAAVLLSNGEKSLSVSWIPDSLTIYISFAN